MRHDRDCDGFPSWVEPDDAATLVQAVTDWLAARTPRILNSGLGSYFVTDVREIVTPLLGRYSDAPRRPAQASRECPVCGHRTVIVNFEDEGDGVMVGCTFCGHAVPDAVVARFLPEVERV